MIHCFFSIPLTGHSVELLFVELVRITQFEATMKDDDVQAGHIIIYPT
jgi:hypothetical protein